MIPIDSFRMGYFIVYKNQGGFFGDQIVKRQLAAGFSHDDAQYSHVEVSGGEISSIDISPPFSKLVDITQVHKGRYAKLMRYNDLDYEYGKRYKVAYFSATLANKGYDVPGILSFLFKWIKHNNRLYFCSEGCAESLQRVFPDALSGMPPNTVMPAHFLWPEFVEVWKGEI